MTGVRSLAVLALILLSGVVEAQSALNWGAVTPSSSPAASSSPLPSAPTARAAVTPQPTVSVTAPVAGYFESDEPEPNLAPTGRVDPAVALRFQQQSGESQDAYIQRMSVVYQAAANKLRASTEADAKAMQALVKH